jgi:hypothetical protein
MKPIRVSMGATPNHPTKPQKNMNESPISKKFIKGNIDNVG